MTPHARGNALAGFTFSVVDASESAAVLDAHRLLREALGDRNVEDLRSFRATVSPATDVHVVPMMLSASHGGRLQGIVLGVYLHRVKVGMVLYSAVSRPFRGRGAYTYMRSMLVDWLAEQAAPGPEYIISELDAGGRLGRKYIREWGALVAPCDYETPAAQGIVPRRLDLLIQPMARRSPPTGPELEAIVREVYGGVYRLESVERSAIFHRVVQSVRATVLEGRP
jgi:hypothetical protein